MFMTMNAADTIAQPDVATTRWRIDPSRSTVAFTATMLWGLSKVTGRFGRYEGGLDLAGWPAVELTVDAGSIATNIRRRDKHLRSADFFDAERHPSIRFVSDGAMLTGDRLAIDGQLHVGGRATPIEAEATLRPVGGELEIEVVAAVDQRLLGIARPLVGAPTALRLTGRLVPEVG
jgi:polyisoprenoid-binding protein YceI